HFVALALLVDQPVEQVVHHRKIGRTDVCVIFVKMLEMGLFHHGRLVDMEGDGDAVVVGNFDELLHVFDVGAADVGVEENGVAVAVLPTDEIGEIGADVFEGFRQAGLFGDGVDGEVNGGDAGVGEPVGNFGPEQTGVGGEIDPEIFFRGVINDLVD